MTASGLSIPHESHWRTSNPWDDLSDSPDLKEQDISFRRLLPAGSWDDIPYGSFRESESTPICGHQRAYMGGLGRQVE